MDEKYTEFKPVTRIAGALAPSGSGKFPVARACDILMPDNSRLDDYLDNFEVGGTGLPPYTDADNGKFLRLVDGEPTWVRIEDGDEVEY